MMLQGPKAVPSTSAICMGLVLGAAMVCAPLAAFAQDWGHDQNNDRGNAYDRAPSDEAYAWRGDAEDGGNVPYAGRYLGYDYISDEYYRWDGPAPIPPQADEQDGYREGVLHTRPAGYRYYGRGYGWRRYDLCGCGRYSYYRVYKGWGEHDYVQLDPRRRPYR